MRTTALPSMLEILARNYAFHNKDVQLYELAKIYLPRDDSPLANEPKVFVFGAYGPHTTFYSLKGQVEALLRQLNIRPAEYTAAAGEPQLSPRPLRRPYHRRQALRRAGPDPSPGREDLRH